MTLDGWLLDETRKWLGRAQRDLRVAGKYAPELPAEALFHCRRAAEKLLKAFLTWNQTPFRPFVALRAKHMKTHELRELTIGCSGADATVGRALEPALVLSKYAWQFRYPGAPYEPDAGEAAQGIALAKLVWAEIGKRLRVAATTGFD
jgi:HEPN domain-containing protein